LMNDKDARIRREIDNLSRLTAPQLRVRWAEVYSSSAPRRISADLLRRAIAYRIQEKAYGGLRPAIVRRLKQIAEDVRAGREVDMPQVPPALRPGARLMREWQGETHVVDVVEGGFIWRGKRYASLSVIARTITGTHWSGPNFFGLRDKRPKAPISDTDVLKAFR
jgi:hypothetical protein